MSNTILTPTAVTREALRILHQKLNFIGNIDRQYDSAYAVEGAKIGSQLKIRLPNEYTIRTGKNIDVQDVVEASETLTLATQKGVDVEFSSADLTLSIDDYGKRILEPQMSVLAANIESDALSMYKDVPNQSNNVGSSATMAKVLVGRKQIVDNLGGASGLSLNMDTQMNVDIINQIRGLFNETKELSKQFLDGIVGRTAGFTWFENTMMPIHTSGTDDGTGDYLADSATAQTGSTITVNTGTGTFKKGDIITIANVLSVHPETKISTGVSKQFTITADQGVTTTEITIFPAIVLTGGRQNVNAAVADNSAITKIGGASTTYNISLGYPKDAFTFVTADLLMPQGVHFAGREVMDGISMRIVADYNITSDTFPSRIDVLYGFKTIRGQIATRFANN